MNKEQQDLLDILKLLKRSSNTKLSSNNVYTTEVYKMFVHTILQLSEDKINGVISPDTEEKITKLRYYFSKHG
jgi:hypothetical protein